MGTKSAEKSVYGFGTASPYAANKGTVPRQCFEMQKNPFGAHREELFTQIQRCSSLPHVALPRSR